MANIFGWMQDRKATAQRERLREQAVVKMVEELVEIADPKIRLAHRYRQVLLPLVEGALAYCRQMAGSIPGPVRLHQKTYHDNPSVKALFRSVEELDTLLREARHSAAAGDSKELFALLTMTKRETIFHGNKQEGEMILADVPMKAVTFVDHRIVSPTPELESTITRLVQRSLELLASVAMEKIASLKIDLAELRERRARLSSMQRIFGGKRQTSEIFARSEEDIEEKLDEVHVLLGKTEREIETKNEIETPEYKLRCLQQIIASPADTLALRDQSLKLNWMNVLVASDAEPFHRIDLAELTLNEELRRSAVLVSFDR